MNCGDASHPLPPPHEKAGEDSLSKNHFANIGSSHLDLFMAIIAMRKERPNAQC